MSEAETKGGIQAVHRALDILEAVAGAGVTRVTGVAVELGLPVSTAHSIFSTLAARHYLLRVPGGYRLGPAAAGLSARWDLGKALSLTIDSVMQELTTRSGVAATATVLSGREARILASLPAPGPITAVLSANSWQTPLSLATGRLLVAFGPRRDWDTFVEADSESRQRWSISRWTEEFESIRNCFVAVKLTSDPRLAVGMAVPVIGPGGVVACSVGSFCPSFLAQDLFNAETLQALCDAAQELTAALGGPPLPKIHLDFHALLAPSKALASQS